MAGCIIEQTVEERDLGILIDNQGFMIMHLHLWLLAKQKGFWFKLINVLLT